MPGDGEQRRLRATPAGPNGAGEGRDEREPAQGTAAMGGRPAVVDAGSPVGRLQAIQYVDDVGQAEVVSPLLRAHVRSLVGAPLIVEGRLIGVVHVGSTTPRHFDPDEAERDRLRAEVAGG